jgi:disulfide oxidoreductase YuzD
VPNSVASFIKPSVKYVSREQIHEAEKIRRFLCSSCVMRLINGGSKKRSTLEWLVSALGRRFPTSLPRLQLVPTILVETPKSGKN